MEVQLPVLTCTLVGKSLTHVVITTNPSELGVYLNHTPFVKPTEQASSHSVVALVVLITYGTPLVSRTAPGQQSFVGAAVARRRAKHARGTQLQRTTRRK